MSAVSPASEVIAHEAQKKGEKLPLVLATYGSNKRAPHCILLEYMFGI